MPILALLNRMNQNKKRSPHPILEMTGDLRYGYLLGIAICAHADQDLDENERNHFIRLSQAFNVDEAEAEKILAAAKEPDETAIDLIRRKLIHTKYKYYFIVDLQIMAHQDHRLKHIEVEVIQEFATLLGIEPADLEFFTELANAVVTRDPSAKDDWVRNFLHRPGARAHLDPDHFAHYTEDD